MKISLIDSLPLRAKLAALPIILVGALLLVVTKVSTGIQTQREEATLINAAGRQRMLNQRYVKEVMRASSEVGVSEDPAYKRTRNLFMSSLKSLTEGGELVVNPMKGTTRIIPAARDPLLIEGLQRNLQLAVELEVLAMDYLNSSDGEKLSKLGPLLELNALLHAEANQAVQLFVKQSNDGIDALIWRCITISLFAAVISILVSIVVSSSITRPIELVRNRLKNAAQGDLSEVKALSRKDEFGQMSIDLGDTLAAVRTALGTSRVDWEEVATLFNDMKADLNSVRAIVTQVPTAMVLLDTTGLISYMNPRAETDIVTLVQMAAVKATFKAGDNISQARFGCEPLWKLCGASNSHPHTGVEKLGQAYLDLSVHALRNDIQDTTQFLVSWQIVTDDVIRQQALLQTEQDEKRKAAELTDLINELECAVQAASQGNLDQRIALGTDEKLNGIATTINTFMQHTQQDMITIKQRSLALQDAAAQLSTSADSLDLHAKDSSQMTHCIVGASDKVDNFMSAASAATRQMSASILDICGNTTSADQVARQAVSLTDDAAVTVNKLYKSSGDIGNVLNFITSIAEQTNLLALNATIEAARAGDAGKGFAVVANEVKELAKQTADATSEIGTRIAAIQSDSTHAVQSINAINDIVDKISGYQTAIAIAINDQTTVSRELTTTIERTADSSANIRDHITELANQNKVGGQVLDASRVATVEVTQCARQLDRVLTHYQLDVKATRFPSV